MKAAKTAPSQLRSASNRLKLTAQPRAYFVKLGPGIWLGYRRLLNKPGMWVARAGGADGKGWEKTLWTADDAGLKANDTDILSFWQAKAKMQELAGQRKAAPAAAPADTVLTVSAALARYEAALRERGASLHNAKLPRRHLGNALLSKPVTLVAKADLERFRESMVEKGLAPSSVNRVMNCLRAALTLADKTRVHLWRDGLKALNDATEANNVAIPDEATAQRWVAETYALDHQLGLLTHTIAETGARPSQCARLKVQDLITDNPTAPRLLMPKSGKGGTRNPGKRKTERYSVPISPELAALLKAAAAGRSASAVLLLRSSGEPWREPNFNYQYRNDVRTIVSKIGLDPDEYGLYAFRHTSITRMLLKGIPTAIVAKAHDTGEAMIRAHYADRILDYSDQITRDTLPALGPAQPAGSNVVPMTARK